jgi:hypothetical protein
MLEEFYMWTVSDNFLTFRFYAKWKLLYVWVVLSVSHSPKDLRQNPY